MLTLYNIGQLALTSPTGGGRSVGIVRSRTKATVFFFSKYYTKHFVTSCLNKQFRGELKPSLLHRPLVLQIYFTLLLMFYIA
jgi:hypothetical protein